MNLSRRQSFPLPAYRNAPVEQQFGRMAENIFEDIFSQMLPYTGWAGGMDDTAGPRMNLVETDKAFEVEAEMPGVTKDDLRISIDHRRLTIEAEVRRADERKEGETVVYSERTTRRYARSMTLPVDVDDGAAQARLEHGVLKLVLPKKEPAQSKKITVQ